MDTLRLVLILLGIIIVVGIYIFSRKSSGLSLFTSRDEDNDIDTLIPEPPPLSDEDIANAVRSKRYASDVPDEHDIVKLSNSLSAGVQQQIDHDDVESMSSFSEDEQAEPLLIVMTIMAKHGELLNGSDVYAAANAAGFKHGEMNIFHYHDETVTDQRPVCSLANTIEPGYFDLQSMNEMQTPGLTLFMQLPGPLDSRRAFEQTLKLGRQLAEQLEAELCDESRSVITMQSIEHLKEKIEAYLFKSRMAQIQKHRN